MQRCGKAGLSWQFSFSIRHNKRKYRANEAGIQCPSRHLFHGGEGGLHLDTPFGGHGGHVYGFRPAFALVLHTFHGLGE